MAVRQLKFSAKAQQGVRAAVLLGLVIWLAWLAADTLWLFISGPTRPLSLGRDMVLLQPGSDAAGRAQSDAATVQGWQLFGPLEVDQKQVVEAPETRLRLELLGVFQNTDAQKAGAIIAEQGKDGELYHTGDKVPGNATLEEVFTDHVILLRMGQREALRMKEDTLAGGFTETSVSTPPPQQQAPDSQADTGTAGGDDLAQQRNMIISRLALSPAEGGGYRIGPAAPAQMLQVVGLRPGDVLVSVNGYDVGDEQSDMAALEEFRNTGAASIVVQRGEQRFTVNYPP